MKTLSAVCALACLVLVSASDVPDVQADPEVDVGDWDTYCPTAFPGLCKSQSFTEGHTVYTYFTHHLNFTDAEMFCRRKYRDGHLASIHSYRINRLVTCLTTHCNHAARVWIGGFELFRSGRFTWTDGTHWDYSPWIAGFPVRFTQACVELNWNIRGTWSDHSCYLRKPFVCKHSF
ncbi:lectin-like [Lepisosteus oculatus]|uniref:lectin-like n=1 Tax=Lepisosteus oculatus TaxID=7918 RepID=UPI0035F50BDD